MRVFFLRAVKLQGIMKVLCQVAGGVVVLKTWHLPNTETNPVQYTAVAQQRLITARLIEETCEEGREWREIRSKMNYRQVGWKSHAIARYNFF